MCFYVFYGSVYTYIYNCACYTSYRVYLDKKKHKHLEKYSRRKKETNKIIV